MCTAAWLIDGAVKNIICSLMAHQPQWGLITETLWSHSDTLHSLRRLWTSDQSDTETSTWHAHNTHNIQTSIKLAGFKPVNPACERLQTHALDRATTGNGKEHDYKHSMINLLDASGLPHGGSSTVHIYTQTIHITTQIITEQRK